MFPKCYWIIIIIISGKDANQNLCLYHMISKLVSITWNLKKGVLRYA